MSIEEMPSQDEATPVREPALAGLRKTAIRGEHVDVREVIWEAPRWKPAINAD